MSRSIRVFVDTNIIIEAYRTGCWEAICKSRSLEVATVEACVEEALARGEQAPKSEQIPPRFLRSKYVARHEVTSALQATWKLRLAGLEPEYQHDGDLGDGERDLLAWLILCEQPSEEVLLATADGLALAFAHQFGLLEHTISLQGMIKKFKIRNPRRQLRRHYTNNWLLKARSDLQAEGSK